MIRFRVLVTGSRSWDWPEEIYTALDDLKGIYHSVLTIVHGACPRGADAIADAWCRRTCTDTERFRADWSRGRSAGYARNAAMVASQPARCIAFIHAGSKGASQCADLAERAGIPTMRFERP